jgi:hypothetical protein
MKSISPPIDLLIFELVSLISSVPSVLTTFASLPDNEKNQKDHGLLHGCYILRF